MGNVAAVSAADIDELDNLLTDVDLNGGSVPVTTTSVAARQECKPLDDKIFPPKIKASKQVKMASAKDFYAAISPADALGLEAAEKNIRKYGKAIGESILKIGAELLQVKQAMSGIFVQWTKERLDFDTRTAQRYMKAAEAFGHAPKVVEKLPGDLVYALASDSIPDVLRIAIVSEVNRGRIPTRADIEARIRAAKQASAAPKAATAAASSTAVVQSAPMPTSRADAEKAAEMLAGDFTGHKGDLLALLQAVNPVEFLQELKAAITA